MNLIRRAWAIVKENRRAYIIINVAYYGLVAIFMVVAAFNQSVQESLVKISGAGFTSGIFAFVGKTYGSGQVLSAMGITFAINFFVGTFLEITLPSLVIPFIGMFMGILRAALWGLLLSPAYPPLRLLMIPHSLTLILEGQGYIMGLLAVYVQGKAFLWPGSAGVEGHWQGYLEGLKRTGWLYSLVILVLFVAAVYEALEVIFLAPLFH
jgi:hypothetical protein